MVECTDAAAEFVVGALENDEYANGAACVANIVAREDRVGMRVARPGLDEYGVEDGQGYVIGHPAPIAEVLEECPPWPT